mmetsp:Transcript_15451/g.39861  ORF Transcript_15451/g.39861 Transcript_15451/m.39861 type:complete len:311 (-) Transcript_15451:133-1065(-)
MAASGRARSDLLLLTRLRVAGVAIARNHHGVIALIGLQRELLEWLELLVLELGYLLRKDVLRRGSGIDAVRLDRDHAVALVLEEEVRVHRHDARLVGLRHIGEDAVDHADQHAVLLRVARILDDRDDVGALLGDVDEVATGAVRELDGVHAARLTHQVGDVRHRCAGGGAKVQDLRARTHVDRVNTAEDSRGDLGAEGIPDAVLDLSLLVTLALLHCYPLLAIDSITRHHRPCDKHVLLAARDKDTRVPVGFDDDLGAALGATFALALTLALAALALAVTLPFAGRAALALALAGRAAAAQPQHESLLQV